MCACMLSLLSCHPCFHSKGTFVALWVEWNGKHNQLDFYTHQFWSVWPEKNLGPYFQATLWLLQLSQTHLPFATQRPKWKWAQHTLSQLPEKARPVMSWGGGRQGEWNEKQGRGAPPTPQGGWEEEPREPWQHKHTAPAGSSHPDRAKIPLCWIHFLPLGIKYKLIYFSNFLRSLQICRTNHSTVS